MSRGLVVEAGPQHRARQAQRAAEQLSRTVVEGLEEGVVVTDGGLRAVSWNRSALQILGLDAAALGTATAPFVAPETMSDTDGGALGDDADPIARAAREGKPARAVVRLRHAEGERYVTILARPIAAEPATAPGVVCTYADVTATVEAERDLRDERDRAKRYLEVASTIVVVLDGRGRVELINRQGCDLLGFEESDLVGRDWVREVVPPADRLDARLAFSRLVEGVQPPAELLETVVRTRSGEERTIAWRNAVLTDDSGRIVSVLRSGADVTDRRKAQAEVAHMAYHDRLTGLANRTKLEEQLGHDLTRARRSDRPLALLYIDLDDFKLVNDSLGHAAGDGVLHEAARRIDALIRGGDLLCRQGGDEFLLLLNCEAGEDAATVAREAGERIADALEQPFSIMDAEFHVGASIGAALFPDHGDDAEGLLKRADSAMYQAKGQGGGTVAIYEEEDNNSGRRLALTTQLRRAIARDELRVFYQPIFRVDDGSLSSLEALVRWEHPEQGLVPPGEFIPVAEQTGLIDAVGDWVVEEVCRQAAEWAAQGRRPMLTFNVSPRQLRRADLVASIVERIERHGLDTTQFCVELTETSVLSDERRHRSLLTELHDASLAIAIDDFGSGHSSLSRLRDLPVHVLKVDRSFLARVPSDARASAIVAAVLSLSEALGLTTVVEGVEEEEQLEFLRERGCQLVQGYLLGRPVPADALDVTRLPVAAGGKAA